MKNILAIVGAFGLGALAYYLFGWADLLKIGVVAALAVIGTFIYIFHDWKINF